MPDLMPSKIKNKNKNDKDYSWLKVKPDYEHLGNAYTDSLRAAGGIKNYEELQEFKRRIGEEIPMVRDDDFNRLGLFELGKYQRVYNGPPMRPDTVFKADTLFYTPGVPVDDGKLIGHEVHHMSVGRRLNSNKPIKNTYDEMVKEELEADSLGRALFQNYQYGPDEEKGVLKMNRVWLPDGGGLK